MGSEENRSRVRLTAVAAGVSLLVPAWVGLDTGRPTILAPMPLLTSIPAFALWRWNYMAAVLIPPLLFLFWNPGLLKGATRIPKRSYVLLIAASGLSVPWFLATWSFAVGYHGARYTQYVCAINSAWLVALWAFLLSVWRRGQSFKANLIFHWVLFTWLSWYAFPYLGELP